MQKHCTAPEQGRVCYVQGLGCRCPLVSPCGSSSCSWMKASGTCPATREGGEVFNIPSPPFFFFFHLIYGVENFISHRGKPVLLAAGQDTALEQQVKAAGGCFHCTPRPSQERWAPGAALPCWMLGHWNQHALSTVTLTQIAAVAMGSTWRAHPFLWACLCL